MRLQVVGTPGRSTHPNHCADWGLYVLDARIHGRSAVLLSHVEEAVVPSDFLDFHHIDGGIDVPPVNGAVRLRGYLSGAIAL
jgi:hypothetical protein